MPFEILSNDTNDVLILKMIGDISSDELVKFFDSLKDKLKEKSKKYLQIDLSLIGEFQSEVEKTFIDQLEKLSLQRLSVVSPMINQSTKNISKAILQVNGLSEASSFFKSEREALSWLLK